MQLSLNSKIREIISHYQISDRQFAMKIGVNQSVIASMFQKGTEPSSKVIIKTLASFPDISSEWFTRDEGEMFAKNKDVARINSLIDTISTLQETINAKNDTIASLNDRIQQLENQLNNR